MEATNKEWLQRAYNLEKYIRELKTAYSNAFESAVYLSPGMGEFTVNTSIENTIETVLIINRGLYDFKTA